MNINGRVSHLWLFPAGLLFVSGRPGRTRSGLIGPLTSATGFTALERKGGRTEERKEGQMEGRKEGKQDRKERWKEGKKKERKGRRTDGRKENRQEGKWAGLATSVGQFWPTGRMFDTPDVDDKMYYCSFDCIIFCITI